MRTPRLILLALLALAAAACLEVPPLSPDVTAVNYAPELGVNFETSTRTASGLYYRDLVVGNGAVMRQSDGDTALVRYTGWLRNGIEFDSNLGSSNPLRFATGAGTVIAGFDEGVRGMAVNGQRQLIIPSNLGYGGAKLDNIPRNSVLVFTITLIDIKRPTPQ